jgi:predicted 2-oxoglutarate/Fe(II)-dependent dioxygenase YbiX
MAPIGAFAGALDLQGQSPIVYVADASGLESASFDGQPAAIVLDRSGRILDLQPAGPQTDLAALFAHAAARAPREEPRVSACPAPILVIPNVASPEFCRALIDHFEASPHVQGVMASYVDGEAQARLDTDKKHRRDIELTAGSPIHTMALGLIAARVAPEIKRAFQKDITFADRILIARYDDDGGYFKRHRDNAAPQTAFREFAISLNLNTDEYEGGELLFPEFNDHRYSPPAGGAVVFSASLLHEAAPVTRGSRYVLLSFLCGGPPA